MNEQDSSSHSSFFGGRQRLNYDLTKSEFICPICERLSSCCLPIVPSLANLQSRANASEDSFPAFSAAIRGLVDASEVGSAELTDEEEEAEDGEEAETRRRFFLRRLHTRGVAAKELVPKIANPDELVMPRDVENMAETFQRLVTKVRKLASCCVRCRKVRLGALTHALTKTLDPCHLFLAQNASHLSRDRGHVILGFLGSI